VIGAAAHVFAGFGVGLALAGAPGPVQAILFAEAMRGGIGRGIRAMVGANGTFGLMLVALALGISLAPPSGVVLRALKVVGGGFLLWLAVEGFRSASETAQGTVEPRRSLPPTARGTLAVLLNPGAWLFLGAVASPLLGAATRDGGTASALLVVLALVIGVMIGDGAVVVFAGVGLRRAGQRVETWVRRGLAIVLAGLGLWLIVGGVLG
jgi:threonine/homoserine/homoserine lactone efflux protein